MNISKITISIEPRLLQKIDLLIKERVFQNRPLLKKLYRFDETGLFVNAPSWMQKKNKHSLIFRFHIRSKTHAKAWTLNKKKECGLFGRPHSVGIILDGI